MEKIKTEPPKSITTLCKPLVQFKSNDVRDAIKTVVKNNNIYFLCASKMKSAVIYINNQN